MKYAVITGATRGIGKAIGEKLLAEGFSLAVCARTKKDLVALEKKWKVAYPAATIIVYRADVGNKDEVTGFGDAVLSKFPRVDILVNNAGVYMQGLFEGEREERFETVMRINLYSAYYLTRQLLPVMKKKKSGHIFNMCSVASLKAYPGGGIYGISKYALLGFSENLREELRPHLIKVTSLCLGATDTDTWEGSGIPAERMMAADDVADTVWSVYNLSKGANADTIIMRPVKGDL